MSQSQRKLVGLLGMLPLMAVYALGATLIYERLFAGLPGWVLVPYFAVAGFGFVVPAAWLTTWMLRPDGPRKGR